MKHIECCSECGAKKIVYKRALRPPMIWFLKRLSHFSIPMKLSDMKGVSPSMYPDIKRLTLWGFIEQTEKFHYSVTEYGISFLNGKISVPYTIYTYRNNIVLPPSGELVKNVYINDVVNKDMNKHIALEESTNVSEYINPLSKEGKQIVFA